jgi:hypothetical protein
MRRIGECSSIEIVTRILKTSNTGGRNIELNADDPPFLYSQVKYKRRWDL